LLVLTAPLCIQSGHPSFARNSNYLHVFYTRFMIPLPTFFCQTHSLSSLCELRSDDSSNHHGNYAKVYRIGNSEPSHVVGSVSQKVNLPLSITVVAFGRSLSFFDRIAGLDSDLCACPMGRLVPDSSKPAEDAERGCCSDAGISRFRGVRGLWSLPGSLWSMHGWNGESC